MDTLLRIVRESGGSVCDHPHAGWHGGIGMLLATRAATEAESLGHS
jgi:hypothetical protein